MAGLIPVILYYTFQYRPHMPPQSFRRLMAHLSLVTRETPELEGEAGEFEQAFPICGGQRCRRYGTFNLLCGRESRVDWSMIPKRLLKI